MRLELITIAERPEYTIGKLMVNGKYFCDTLEPQTRDLHKCTKVDGKTAIPAGTYPVTVDVYSCKFGKQPFYQLNADGGRLPRLANVPQFDGVLIHVGNTPSDTQGCILVGRNRQVGQVLDSKAAFKDLYQVLKAASNRGEYITITVKRKSY